MSQFKLEGAFMINKNLRDFRYTLTANIINLLLGIITGFLIPKFLSIDEYGYLKLYTFYCTYIGFFHFGFIDGIYVRYGSYDYDEIPKEKFRCYFKFLLLFQVIVCLILIIIVTFLIPNGIKRETLYYVIINLIIVNITLFFSFINQFTRRFKLYSNNLIIPKILYVIGSAVFFIIGLKNHIYFIFLYLIGNTVVLLSYGYYDKDLIFGKSEKIKDNFADLKSNFSIGFFVMIGNFMNIIIIGLDRLFIDYFFTLQDFAMYSFAYSIISVFYILLSALATVVFPYLARVDKSKMKDTYEIIKIFLVIIIGASLSCFFLIKYILIKFLPNYIPSLSIITVLIPTVLLTGQNSILISNYYKILNYQKEYSLNNIVIFCIAIITNIIAYVIFKTSLSIAVASLISFIIWIFYSEHFFIKKLNIKIGRTQAGEILLIILFLIIALNFSWYQGFFIYLFGYFLIIVLLFRNNIKEIKKILRR
jgi:O-antigen/teichoic acid export membrane protein